MHRLSDAAVFAGEGQMRILILGLLVIAALLGLALYGPGSLNAMRFEPPPVQSALLERLETETLPVRNERADLFGAEDVEPGPDGRLYASLADGRIMARAPQGDWTEIANTGGRPLGLSFGPDGALYVADARLGLLRLADGAWEVWLADRSAGGPLVFTDDLTVLEDGRIILTDASLRHGYGHHMESFLEAEQTGRILVVTAPDTYTILADGLAFINGVDHDPATGQVFITETWAGRVWSLDSHTGALSVLIEGLPGYPDNADFDPQTGLVWIALPSLRSEELERLHPRPLLKRLVWRALQVVGLPDLPDRPPLVMALTPQGEVVHVIRGPVAPADGVTGVTVWNGEVWTSGLARDGFTVFDLPGDAG
jgi:sugar lactone lactonase YvrE